MSYRRRVEGRRGTLKKHSRLEVVRDAGNVSHPCLIALLEHEPLPLGGLAQVSEERRAPQKSARRGVSSIVSLASLAEMEENPHRSAEHPNTR